VMPKKSYREAQERIGNGFDFVIATRLLRCAGVMNVADDEKSFALHRVRKIIRESRAERALLKNRENKMERGTLVRLTFHRNRPLMHLNDAARDRQAESRAFRFRGEERLENSPEIFRWNSCAAV